VRHFWNAGFDPKPPKLVPPEPDLVRPPVNPPAGGVAPLLPKVFCRSLVIQDRSAAVWAAVSVGGFTVVEIVWPPVL